MAGKEIEQIVESSAHLFVKLISNEEDTFFCRLLLLEWLCRGWATYLATGYRLCCDRIMWIV